MLLKCRRLFLLGSAATFGPKITCQTAPKAPSSLLRTCAFLISLSSDVQKNLTSCCSILFSMYLAKELYTTQDMYDYIPKDIYASLRNPIVALPRRYLAFLSIAASFSAVWLLLSYDRWPTFLSVHYTSTTTTHWHGWPNVENLIVLYATDA